MRAVLRSAAAVLTLLLAGCAPGPNKGFRPVCREEVPAGMAVVYLYRPPSLLGTIESCNMEIGDRVVGALDAARYTHVFVAPGKVRFETVGDYRAFVTVNIRAGEEYFIRQTWVFQPAGLQPRLENMTAIKASDELQSCTYVEEPPIIEASEDEESEEEGALCIRSL